jgi:hypothetical protein
VVTKPTGRPRGRPRKPRPPPPSREEKRWRKFLQDPDRYAVALLDALLALEAGSERACAMAVVAMRIGVEGNPQHRAGGSVVTNWECKPTRKGSRAGTLEGAAVTLRQKRAHCGSPLEATWRTAMASAFMVVIGARNPEAARPVILQRAAAVGERRFAERVMLPMLVAKFAPSETLPEFLAKTPST